MQTQRRFRTPWNELDYVCAKVRNWMYAKRQPVKARRFLVRLQQLLEQLPDSGKAMLKEEGLALLHELKGNPGKAIQHRRREIELMGELHRDVASHGYSEATRNALLENRDDSALKNRLAILRSLETCLSKNAVSNSGCM